MSLTNESIQSTKLLMLKRSPIKMYIIIEITIGNKNNIQKNRLVITIAAFLPKVKILQGVFARIWKVMSCPPQHQPNMPRSVRNDDDEDDNNKVMMMITTTMMTIKVIGIIKIY